MVRQVFRVDRRTHRSLIEDISGVPHLKTLLLSRFARKVASSEKFSVRFIANLNLNDNRTTFGSNVNQLLKLCKLAKGEFAHLNKDYVKKTVRYWDPDADDTWRNHLAKELIDTENGHLAIDGFSKKELSSILEYICKN